MSKKKKVDLSTELADLIMGNESDTNATGTNASQQTRVIFNQNEDKTKQIQKNVNDSTQSIEISDKTVNGMEFERGIGARAVEMTNFRKSENKSESKVEDKAEDKTIATKIPEPPETLTKNKTEFFGATNVEEDKNLSEQSAVRELSQFFSQSNTKAGPFNKVESVKAKKQGGDIILSVEASMVQSEQLRIAQDRILELEHVVDDLRTENEQLLAAGETLRTRSDELKAQLEQLQHGQREKNEIVNEEMVLIRTGLAAKSDENSRLKLKIEELEARLSGDIKKIRVRERELENRLEIMKLENQALLKNKDEIILDLKRKIDQLIFELENYRGKSKELNHQVEDNRERVRRTVKALRLALSMLEGEEDNVTPLKKAE